MHCSCECALLQINPAAQSIVVVGTHYCS